MDKKKEKEMETEKKTAGGKKNRRGMLISFEGNDGAGKTTALLETCRRLRSKGYKVKATREPGGCDLSEKIRALLLDRASQMDPRTEALLYAAARREHLVRTIEPALEKGTIVLSDRFLDSSLAYQGAGRSLGIDAVEELNDFALEGFRPDLTLFFSLDLKTGKERLEKRGDLNRLDLEGDGFQQRVRQGFEWLIESHPERIRVLDASLSEEDVLEQVMEILEDALEKGGYDR